MATPTTVFQFNKPTVSGDADAWGGQLNTDWDNLDIFMARPRFKKVGPTVGATTPLDFSLGTYFEFTINQVTTITISNVPATLPDTTVPVTRGFLRITNGGAFAITWPGSIVWPFETANAAPTGLAAAGVDIIEIVSYDAGTTWYAILHHIKTDPNLSPRVSVYKSGTQSAGVGNTIVSFDTERFDVGAMHDNVTNNSRLTIPAGQAGLYLAIAKVSLSNAIPGRLVILKNGATIVREQEANALQEYQIDLLEVLAATDYLEIRFVNSGVGTNTINAGISKTSFELLRVR